MSGHIGLREESRAGHLLAWRIARLFVPAQPQASGRCQAIREVLAQGVDQLGERHDGAA
jgi:hypothetical protein